MSSLDMALISAILGSGGLAGVICAMAGVIQ